MRHIVIGILLFASGLVYAQEKITLSASVFVSSGATDFRVWPLHVRFHL